MTDLESQPPNIEGVLGARLTSLPPNIMRSKPGGESNPHKTGGDLVIETRKSPRAAENPIGAGEDEIWERFVRRENENLGCLWQSNLDHDFTQTYKYKK